MGHGERRKVNDQSRTRGCEFRKRRSLERGRQRKGKPRRNCRGLNDQKSRTESGYHKAIDVRRYFFGIDETPE